MGVFLLGVVLFNETVDVFKDVYRYGVISPQYSEDLYFFERAEFKKYLEDKDFFYWWESVHTPDIAQIGPFFGAMSFGNYSSFSKKLYERTKHLVCYLVPAVSSFREPNYYPEWLVDGKEDTCWCEGVKGAGIGQWMIYPLLVLGDEGERGIQIGFGFLNGNKKCQCNMVSKFEVEISHGKDVGIYWNGPSEHQPPEYWYDSYYENETFELRLARSKEWQYLSFEKCASGYVSYVLSNDDSKWNPTRFWVAKLTIKSVYYGKEKEHTCLSEIRPLFKLNDKEYLTFDCQGRKIIIPASKVKVIEPAPREKDRK